MSENEKGDKEDKMIEILEEMLRWTRVTSIPQVKQLLLETLPSAKEKTAYHYSDGRDSRAISRATGVPFSTVARWWKRWIRAGIAEPVGAKRGDRAKRVFSLEDFGIEIPIAEVCSSNEESSAKDSSGVAETSESQPKSEKTEG
jgi:transposase-like protein